MKITISGGSTKLSDEVKIDFDIAVTAHG
jgi:hypothetical protein